MTWRIEKTGKDTQDLVWSGAEQGIAPSPHKGTANLQNVNINTETGEAMCSFPRIQQTISSFTPFTLTYTGSSYLGYSGAAIPLPIVGQVLSIGAGITTLAAGNYYVTAVTGNTFVFVISLSATYGGANITSFTSGSATASYFSMKTPVAKATEQYFDGTVQQYRYYIIDNKGYVWVNDTATTWSSTTWTPVDLVNSGFGTGAFNWGIGVYQGYLHVFGVSQVWVKETSLLGVAWKLTNLFLNAQNLTQSHSVLIGHQGTMIYTDANYIGTIESEPQPSSTVPGVFSYGSFTATTQTDTHQLTLTTLIGGNFPLIGQKITFTSSGTLPTEINGGVVYYVTNTGTGALYSPGIGIFSVALTVGGNAINVTSAGTGTLYFNSYNPTYTSAANATDANGATTLIFTPQAYQLPFFEIAQSLCEIGDTIIIGCTGNCLYPWNQIPNSSQSGIINLPENNAAQMIAVNNMAYVFAGNKGNIYICNGVTASPVITVPDYCAGIAGTPKSYIEPYFTWGGCEYIRGRMYFSIQDQTAAKTTGNCGGIWSFVPSQNAFPVQDVGIALRLENTNSYGTLNGMATVIMQNQVQAAIGVQYFSAWQSTYTGTSYGIDTSGTYPTVTAIIETDAIPSGTFLNKRSFAQQEYKLASPLLSGESVQLYYRQNLTDSWHTCGTVNEETTNSDTPTNRLSGYFTAAFQNTQWLQLQAQLIPNGTSTFSGNRLTELRLR